MTDANTADNVRLGYASSNTGTVSIIPPATPRDDVVPDNIVSAVYAYLQAERALGKTRINSKAIGRALRIPERLVLLAIKDLQDRGVRSSND